MKDHMGSIMVIFRDDNGDCVDTTEEDPEKREVIERFMYYAFAMEWQGSWRPAYAPPTD